MSSSHCVDIPKIGLGTWSVGGYGTPDTSKSIDDWAENVAYFLSCGGRHIDTAPVYAGGYAETIIGRALHLSAVKREDLFISTKVAAENLAFSNVIDSAYHSLQRMNTEYIDLLYIHCPNPNIPLEETLKAFSFLKQQGVVKNIGVSNFSRFQLEEALHASPEPIVANQLHYNLIVREPEYDGLLDFCRENSVKVISWRPLQSVTFNHDSVISPLSVPGAYPILDEIAQKYGVSVTQMALAWLIQQRNVCAVVKSLNKSHIDEIITAPTIGIDSMDMEKLTRFFPIQFRMSDSLPLATTTGLTSVFQPSPPN